MKSIPFCVRLFSISFLFFQTVVLTASPSPLQLHGAGASFPYPIYSQWFRAFSKENQNVQINYQSLGSGAGVQQFINRTVDFGATDAPMTEKQIESAGQEVIHFPTVLGAVVLTYNLAGVSTPLVLDGPTIALIFLGEIKVWNDPRLVALNPAIPLPAIPIAVIHRSDGSGTTAVFSDYLAKVSPAWEGKVGTGSAIKWPVGLGGKGNEGVSGMVKQLPGSIGYVELVYARTNELAVAKLLNKAGKVVEASPESVTAAAATAKIPKDFRVSITNASGDTSYPISSFTYLLVWKKPKDLEKNRVLLRFLGWAYGEGQGFASKMHYAPLPKPLLERVAVVLDGLKGG